jgi:hypothetical protein
VIIKRPRRSLAPFHVQDLSPWSDEVLFCDVHDMPVPIHEWYVFNLKTCEMKKIGNTLLLGSFGFYVQCDIIQEAAEKFKERKGGE